jgi:predicted DNA-binding transcriptional regulator AlpA
VLHNRTLPAGALSYEQLVDEWIAAAKKQNEASDRAAFRERLRYALMADWPKQVESQVDGEKIVLGRAGKGDRVPGLWIHGHGPAALVVDSDGSAAARRTPEVEKLIQAGRSVLLIDAFQTGAAVAPRGKQDKFYLTFHKSDDSNRVQDILTALAFLEKSGNAELIGMGRAAVWALFAAAVAPQPVKLQADLGNFHGSDQDFIDHFFVPGIQRAGGLRAAEWLAEGKQ